MWMIPNKKPLHFKRFFKKYYFYELLHNDIFLHSGKFG